ncbi:hypothetical protein Pcinc_031064 [Petrolisthes cinctipes]|uniref:Uncharacterized protein n=1 Tax=Petrolisthes cinctipes TaxID=88211 RepID=A0AAE1K363_PETCI|nr:hypothetical protein Pcinc_031064 [Petrolisthes cinctipes]
MDLEAVKVLLAAQDKTFKTALDIIVEQLKSRIQHSEETITDLVKSLEFTQAEVKELQNEVSVLKTSNNDNKTTIEIMKSQIEELERRTNYQEVTTGGTTFVSPVFKNNPVVNPGKRQLKL